MKRIFYLFVVLLLVSCGHRNTSEPVPQSDTTASETDTARNARRHNADNFYAFHYKDDGIYVGNNVEMLTKLDLGDGYAPVLSSDGNVLAYTEPDSAASSVHLYDISNKKDKKLNFGPYSCMSGDFGADGRLLAYSIRNDRNIWTICLYDTQNRTNEVLSAANTQDGDYRPTFSPDGEFLLFHNMRKVMIFRVDGLSVKRYKDIYCESFCQRNALVITPSSKFQMTADHKSIVFTCEDYSTGVRGFQQLFIYDIATSRMTEILSPEYSCGDFQISDDGHIYYIQISPDGSRYLYMAPLSDLKAVRVSQEKLGNYPTLSLAY